MNRFNYDENEKPNDEGRIKCSSDEIPKWSLPYPFTAEIKNCDEDFIPVQITCYMGDQIWKGYDEDGKTVFALWENVHPVE